MNFFSFINVLTIALLSALTPVQLHARDDSVRVIKGSSFVSIGGGACGGVSIACDGVSVNIPKGHTGTTIVNSGPGTFSFFYSGISSPAIERAVQSRAEAEVDRARAEADLARANADKAKAAKQTPAAGTLVPPSPPPRFARIKNEGGNTVGALSELIPHSGIFLTARHVLQRLPRHWLERGLREAGAQIDQLAVFGFLRDGRELDAVMLVPRAKIREVLSGTPGRYTFQNLRAFALDVRPRDHFASDQLGALSHTATGPQFSYGIVSRIEEPYAYLPLTNGNFTSLASSGALVLVASGDTSPERIGSGDWKIGGIVECIHPGFTERNVPVKGAARMITARALWSSQIVQIESIDHILVEIPYSDTAECVRSDRRGGGGERGKGGK